MDEYTLRDLLNNVNELDDEYMSNTPVAIKFKEGIVLPIKNFIYDEETETIYIEPGPHHP